MFYDVTNFTEMCEINTYMQDTKKAFFKNFFIAMHIVTLIKITQMSVSRCCRLDFLKSSWNWSKLTQNGIYWMSIILFPVTLCDANWQDYQNLQKYGFINLYQSSYPISKNYQENNKL